MTNSNLPANVVNMASALIASASQAGVANGPGDMYAKMARDGTFLYGVENTEFEEGAIWAVNPAGFIHGYTAWGTKEHGTEGKNMGEVIVPATQPMPLEGDLPDVKGEWTTQVGIQMRCTNGEDEGIQVMFKTNSHGGRKAYAVLLQEIVMRAQSGKPDFVPLVECTSESYEHKIKTYGTIHNPVFKIVGWTDMDGNAFDDQEAEEEKPAPKARVKAEPEPEPEPEVTPRRRRRKA